MVLFAIKREMQMKWILSLKNNDSNRLKVEILEKTEEKATDPTDCLIICVIKYIILFIESIEESN